MKPLEKRGERALVPKSGFDGAEPTNPSSGNLNASFQARRRKL